MKTLYEILNIIATDISTWMPGQLASAGLDDYQVYLIGQPRDAEQTTLSISYDPDIPIDIGNYKFPILFYAQLYKIEYEDALAYTELIKKFVKNYDSGNKIGATLLDGISVNIIPLERESSTLIFLTATYSEPLDSCDREDEEDES
jgi:hypothetical protein